MSRVAKSKRSLVEPLHALKVKAGGAKAALPSTSVVAGLMQHGGLQILTTEEVVLSRLHRLLPDGDAAETAAIAQEIQQRAQSYFYKLSPDTYVIPSNLMSYLAFPHEGKTYTADVTGASPDPCGPPPTNPGATDPCENPVVPAVFTFVGQFIDHDLTFNGLDLFTDAATEDAAANVDFATPLIDLDSVYGTRFQADGTPQTDNDKVMAGDGSFRLQPVLDAGGNHVPWGYDLPRAAAGTAYIFDPRNDENQMILQIHVLVMRLHNKLLKEIYAAHPEMDAAEALHEARKQTVAVWQRVLLNDYLPRVIQKPVLEWVLTEAAKPGHGLMLHRPLIGDDGSSEVKMPHEFAIGFRFGHSQLRSKYVVNGSGPIPLFERSPAVAGDLRGSTPLPASHVIDWNLFYLNNNYAHLSLRIDTQVTHVVFDLPETAIPDAVKYVGNLPHRNLIRSRQIEVCCGEDLALRYGMAPGDVMTPAEVDGCAASHVYFTQDGERFKTPLWYYILKEAELKGVYPAGQGYPAADSGVPCAHAEAGGYQLGPMGSRLVAEVIVGAIYYGKEFPYKEGWVSPAGLPAKVMLADVLRFVGPVD